MRTSYSELLLTTIRYNMHVLLFVHCALSSMIKEDWYILSSAKKQSKIKENVSFLISLPRRDTTNYSLSKFKIYHLSRSI